MIVKGKVAWASVQKPNEKYTPRWEVCVYPEDEDVIKELEGKGVVFKVDENTGEKFIRVTKNVMRRNGEKNDPPRVVDAAKNPFENLIGNGSVCNVMFNLWEYDSFGNKGVKALLEAVQVINHVPYEGKEDFEVEDTGEEF